MKKFLTLTIFEQISQVIHCLHALRGASISFTDILVWGGWSYFCIIVFVWLDFQNFFQLASEPKAEVSFSIKICPLSVNVNISHFHLLQNHLANFNQTWQKCFFKWPNPIQRGYNHENAKLGWGHCNGHILQCWWCSCFS